MHNPSVRVCVYAAFTCNMQCTCVCACACACVCAHMRMRMCVCMCMCSVPSIRLAEEPKPPMSCASFSASRSLREAISRAVRRACSG